MSTAAAAQGTAAAAQHSAVISWNCEQTVLRFMAHFDGGEYEQMKTYFSESGTWRRPTLTIEGHAGFDEHVAVSVPGRVMRHVITNMRTTLLTDTTAIVESYFTVYLRDRGRTQGTAPSAVGRYTDRLERHAGGWVIADREVHHDIQ